MATDETFDAVWPQDLPLRQRVRDILTKEFDKPEGRVRAQWVLRLVQEYGYHSEQLDVNVAAGAGRDAERSTVFADIVAYRDHARKEPFIVVETKRPAEKAGVKQAESYARNLGADYHVWTDGTTTRYFRTARYVDLSTDTGNIPRWVGSGPQTERLPKTTLLPPFRDEPHLRTVVKVCHDQIFFRLGHDPAKAFDELMKLLFVKLYDERETPRYYEFMCLAGETEKATADRIRVLFGKSTLSRRYRDVFTTKFNESNAALTLDLDDATICFIVQQFQGYSLVNTSATLEGADVKGTVFEKMVGGTFRGELGAYFTPREIVEFTVSMLDPGPDDVVLDPSCGSGGFLIMAIKYVLAKTRAALPNLTDADLYAQIKSFAEKNLFGVDINDRMARVAKMNMIMHGDGHAGIFNEHGLDIGYSRRIPLKFGDVTKVFSNPPFAGREEAPSQLEKFETAKTKSGKVVSLNKTVPFVEMIVNLLAEGGTAGLVLPAAVFNARSTPYIKLRQLIWEKCEVVAVIGLPHWVFFHTGCDVQGGVLVLRRTNKPRADYNVFFDWAENVGYDASGHKTDTNDLPTILQRFKKPAKRNLIKASVLKAAGRYDPEYHRPGAHADQKREAMATGRVVPLTKLVDPVTDTVRRKKGDTTVVRYFEVSDTDAKTGVITGHEQYEMQKLPLRAGFYVRTNDILIPNHRNSIKAKRSVVVVPAEYDGAVCTSRFTVVRPKVSPLYLYHVLNLDFVKETMLRLAAGSSSSDIDNGHLKDIFIPIPPHDDYDTFDKEVREMEEGIAALENELQSRRVKLRGKFTSLLDGEDE